MNIKILLSGRTGESYLKEGIDKYLIRLQHYVKVLYIEMPVPKINKQTEEILKEKEGELFLKQVDPADYLVLLDERGKLYTSVEFSVFLQKRMNSGVKNLVFIVGGPYGFSKELYARANEEISLSKMTFSHEMVRLFFVEQLYRTFTILKGEKYHHE